MHTETETKITMRQLDKTRKLEKFINGITGKNYLGRNVKQM